MLFRIILIILLLPSIGFSATYYVKNGGNDSADGLSDGNAWATIGKLNSVNFANGDTICLKRGSTFIDATLTLDSTSVGRTGITIQDYDSGDKPRIDGNSVIPIQINHAIVNLTIKNIDISGSDTSGVRCYIQDVNGIVIDGLYYDGHVGSSIYYRNNAIQLMNVPGDIEIKNCTIQNVLKDTWENSVAAWGDNDAHAILFWYPTTSKDSGTVSVHDNVMYEIYADCIQTTCVQTLTNIYNNSMTHFGENAVDHKKGRYINIYQNNMSSGGVREGQGTAIAAGAGASYCVDKISQDITVRDNYIYDSPKGGIAISTYDMANYSVYDNYFEDVGMGIFVSRGTNTSIYNNVFNLSEPADDSLILTQLSGIRVDYSPKTDTYIYGNSFYISSSNHLYGIGIQADADATGTIIKNNIFYMARDNASVYPIYIQDYDSSETDPTVQYNNLYGVHTNRAIVETSPDVWTVYDSSEQADWITDGHTGGLFSNPLYTSPLTGDLTLQSGSPSIDSGVNLGAEYDDGLSPLSEWPSSIYTLDQDLYGDGWERGAYVYVPAGPLPTILPPTNFRLSY